MSWMQQGVTTQRNYTDQVQVVTVAGQPVFLPFSQLRTIGYLKSTRLYTPYQAGVVALGGGTYSLGANLQFAQLRQIRDFRYQLQGIAPIYDLQGSAGIDLGMLAYVGNGKPKAYRSGRAGTLGFNNTAAGVVTNNQFAFPVAAGTPPGNGENFMPVAEYISGGPSFNSGFYMEIPLSEWLVFPNTPTGQQGNAILVNDTEMEVGLIFMQNNQQVLSPQITLAPLYAVGAYPAVGLSTGAATVTQNGQSWTIEDEFYDVAPNPADRPSAYQMAFVVTRTSRDLTMSNGIASYQFKQAGLLLRAIYTAYNDTTNFGTLVDLTATPAATLTLKSGSTIIKLQETAGLNAMRCLDRYNTPPPGCLIHDLIWDGNITEAMDTATLVDVRCDFAGLAGAITRLHVVEERLIPITIPA